MTGIKPLLRSLKWIEPTLRDIRGHVLNRRGDPRCRGPVPGMTVTHPRIKRFEQRGHHVFFGYYDICPFDAAEINILACRVTTGAIPGRHAMDVGYFEIDADEPRFHRLGATTSWCWQQGCRWQWLPASGNRAALYNDFSDGQHGCMVIDTSDGRIQERLNMPVYAVNPAGECALSLNFSRLQRLRPGYGYANLPDSSSAVAAPDDDGIWRLDLATGKKELIISLAALANCEAHDTMTHAEHYVNHLVFNPGGSRIAFMHLWLGSDAQRYSRLITCDLDGNNMCVLVNSGRVSHNWWYNDQNILAYSWHNEDSTWSYRMYRDQSNEFNLDPLSQIEQDGHPSFSPDHRRVVTDTYPDLCRRQWLLVHDRVDNEIIGMGRFFSPSRYQGEERCDLHPRWSPSGTRVAVDSTENGKRGLYVASVAAD